MLTLHQSCIGQRFAMIEFKAFMYILLTSFAFKETNAKVVKVNVCVRSPRRCLCLI